MIDPDDLTICTATLLVDPYGASTDDVRAAGAAAVAAGFRSASAWPHHLRPLEEAGLTVAVVEAAFGWAATDAAVATAEAERLAEAAARHGARQVLAVCMEPTLADLGRARDNLARVGEVIAAAGASVVVEFLPWTALSGLSVAWALVEPLDPSVQLLLDTWHWARQPGGPDLELLARIPGDRIGCVQLCDASPTADGDLMTEAMTGRLLPGDGAVDFTALLATVAATGARPVVATEVFAPALVAELGVDRAAAAMYAAATALER